MNISALVICFMGASQSYYLFNSLNDFVTNQAPAGYSIRTAA